MCHLLLEDYLNRYSKENDYQGDDDMKPCQRRPMYTIQICKMSIAYFVSIKKN